VECLVALTVTHMSISASTIVRPTMQSCEPPRFRVNPVASTEDAKRPFREVRRQKPGELNQTCSKALIKHKACQNEDIGQKEILVLKIHFRRLPIRGRTVRPSDCGNEHILNAGRQWRERTMG
jgi:hypothetical protein